MGYHLAIYAVVQTTKQRTSTRLVAVVMGLHAMDKVTKENDRREPGVYYDGIDVLAHECFPNMTPRNARRAVFKALAELEESGLISRLEQPRRGQEQAYRLNLPGVTKPVD